MFVLCIWYLYTTIGNTYSGRYFFKNRLLTSNGLARSQYISCRARVSQNLWCVAVSKTPYPFHFWLLCRYTRFRCGRWRRLFWVGFPCWCPSGWKVFLFFRCRRNRPSQACYSPWGLKNIWKGHCCKRMIGLFSMLVRRCRQIRRVLAGFGLQES